MDRNLEQMMNQMKQDPSSLQALMHSQDGQALIRLLTQDAQAQKAAQSAMRGDTSGMSALMSRLTQTPDGAELMQRISKGFQK